MRSRGIIKNSIKSNTIGRPATKSIGAMSQPREFGQGTKKRSKRAKSESESAVSSDYGGDFEGPANIKSEENEPVSGPQTRGAKYDFTHVFENDSSGENGTDDSFDEYKADADESDDDGDDEKMSHADKMDKSRAPVLGARQLKDSGTPSSPGRFARSANPTISPLTSPSYSHDAFHATKTTVTPSMSSTTQMKQDFLSMKPGTMLPLRNSSSLTTKSHAISSTSNAAYVEESDILESIERDYEEELADIKAGDHHTDMGEEDGRSEQGAPENIMGSPETCVSKKGTKYASGCVPQ